MSSPFAPGVFGPASIVIGFDPGISGAYAVVASNGDVLVDDLPVFRTRTSSGKTRGELDPVALAHLLGSFGAVIDHAFVERVSARPGQGVTSMFRFGYASGVIHGVLAGLKIPHTFVTPQTWQKAMRLGPSPDAARQRATALNPAMAPYLKSKIHQHRADAMLIATWGLSQITGLAPVLPPAPMPAEPPAEAA